MSAGAAGTPHAAFAFLGAFVEELARSGVRHVVLCPGSRSTPLAVTFARQPGIKLWLQVDERSAAFFALGMAKARREPVAVLSTSGTAAANFLPAVVEAHYGRVPLVVLTADRPPELRECGAPQTIDQIHLYGRHVKWFVDMPLPESREAMLRYGRTVAGRAAALARSQPAGPVHLNFPFREPLMPLPGEDASWRGRSGPGPYVESLEGPRVLAPAQFRRLAGELAAAERGLILCGPAGEGGLEGPVLRLAAALGFPVLADPLSGVRCGPHDRSLILDAYDAFLRDPGFAERHNPEVVIRLGAVPTSKPLQLYLQRYPDCRQIVVDGAGGWNDPTSLATEHVQADPALFCEGLAAAVAEVRPPLLAPHGSPAQGSPAQGSPVHGSWTHAWLRANAVAQAAIHRELAEMEPLFEGRVFAELARLLPSGATLFAGNSMPVRDLDTFFPSGPRAIRFLANRGANGIDGVVSSALGAAAGLGEGGGAGAGAGGGDAGRGGGGAGEGGPLVLVIGDLAFYHDLNGLLAAKLHELRALVVLIHNDGGGIFSFLPQAQHPEHFELLFGTPTGLDFRPAVEMYGGRFVPVGSWEEFEAAVREGLASDGLTVLQLRTDRAANVTLHRRVWAAVSRALDIAGLGGGAP